jgi:hypothetical protein
MLAGGDRRLLPAVQGAPSYQLLSMKRQHRTLTAPIYLPLPLQCLPPVCPHPSSGRSDWKIRHLRRALSRPYTSELSKIPHL